MITDDTIKKLIEALEAGLYANVDYAKRDNLRKLLNKLRIKSAKNMESIFSIGNSIQVEDLSSTLKNVSYDDDKIKLHKSLKNK